MFRFAISLILLLCSTVVEAAWKRAESDNFIVYGDVPERGLLSFVEELERFDQLLRAVTNVQARSPRKLHVFLVEDDLRVRRLIGQQGTGVAGAYCTGIRGPFAIAPLRKTSSSVLGLAGADILRHEYVHHFMLQHAPAAYPLWYREGFAEFYSTASFENAETALVGAPPPSRAAYLRGGWWAPYENVLSFGSKGVSIGSDQLYSQGWLLLHAMSSDRALAKQVNDYLARINDGSTTAEAYKAAFGEKNTLHESMKAYFGRSRLPAFRVKLRSVRASPVRLTGLSAAEEELFDLAVRLRGEMKPREVADLAGDIRRRAPKFDNDPFALELIAEAALEEDKPEQAIAAADRLLAARPGSATAMLVKGSAILRQAEAGKDPKDPLWKQGRDWLIKANNAERDNPRILYAYYRSFERQGTAPPRDATDAIVHAFQLYPQNSELRLAAARELHRVSRDKEALAVLKPLANDPHVDSQKSGAAALMKELQETAVAGRGSD